MPSQKKKKRKVGAKTVPTRTRTRLQRSIERAVMQSVMENALETARRIVADFIDGLGDVAEGEYFSITDQVHVSVSLDGRSFDESALPALRPDRVFTRRGE